MTFDIYRMEAELIARKDAFWARKVVFLSGVKASAQMIFIQAKGADVERSIDLLFKLIANDSLTEMQNHYPSKDKTELSREVIKDCDEFLTVMLEGALDSVDGDEGKKD